MSQKFSGFGLNVVYKDCNSRLISSITFFPEIGLKKKFLKIYFCRGEQANKVKEA